MIQDQITKQPKTPRKSISSPNGTVPQILVPKLNLKLVTNTIDEEVKSRNHRANGSANIDSSPKKPMYYSMIPSPAAHQSSRSPVSSKKKSIARREGHRGLSKLNESTLTLLNSKSKLEEWMEKLKEDANIKDLSKSVTGYKDESIARNLDVISDENYEKNYLHRSENRTVKKDLASEVLSLTYSERRRIKMKDIPSSLYLRRKMIPLPPASYEQSSTVSKVKPETEAVCVSLADILKNRSITSQSESMSPSEVRASVSPINMNRKENIHSRSTYRPSPHTEVFSPSHNVKTNPEIENLQKEWQQLIQLADEGLKKGHTESVPSFLLEDLKSPVDKLNIIRESRQKYKSRRGLFDPNNSALSDEDQSENLDEPERWMVPDRDNSFFDRTPSKQNLSLSSYAQRYSVKRHLERYPDDQDCIRRKKIFVNSSRRHKSAPRERTDQPTLQPPSEEDYFSKKLSTNEELRLASFAIDESLTRLKRKKLTLTREEKDARHSLLQNLEDRVRGKSVPRIEINYMPATQTPNSQSTSNNDDPLPNYSLSFTSSSMQQRMQEFKDRARKKVTGKNLPIPEETHLKDQNHNQSTGSVDDIPSSVDISSRIEEIRKLALYRLSKRKKQSKFYSEEVPPSIPSEEMNTTPRKATRPYLETTQGIIEVVKKRLLSNENMSEYVTDLVIEGNSSVLNFLMMDETARGIVIDILSEMVLANLVKSEMNEKQKRKGANPKWAHRNENNPLVMPKKKSLIHEDVKEVISNLTSDDFIAASSNGNLVKRLIEHYVNQRNLSEYPSFEESLPL